MTSTAKQKRKKKLLSSTATVKYDLQELRTLGQAVSKKDVNSLNAYNTAEEQINCGINVDSPC